MPIEINGTEYEAYVVDSNGDLVPHDMQLGDGTVIHEHASGDYDTLVDDFESGVSSNWYNSGNYTTASTAFNGSNSAYRSGGSDALRADTSSFGAVIDQGEPFMTVAVYSDSSTGTASIEWGADDSTATNGYGFIVDWNNGTVTLNERASVSDGWSEIGSSWGTPTPSTGTWYELTVLWHSEGSVHVWMHDPSDGSELYYAEAADAGHTGDVWSLWHSETGSSTQRSDFVRANETHPYTGEHYTDITAVSGGGGSSSEPVGVSSGDVPSANWNLTFEDQFDQGSLDTDTWGIGFGWGRDAGSSEEYVRDQDVWVDGTNDRLVLQSDYDSGSDQFYGGAINSGTPGGNSQSNTRPSTGFTQFQGYWEARMQLLPVAEGLIPGFWAKCDDERWPPELDVMEQMQNQMESQANVHWGASSNDDNFNGGVYSHSTDPSTQFGVWGAHWQDSQTDFYFNGNHYHTVTSGHTTSDYHMNAGEPFYTMFSTHAWHDESWIGNPHNHNNYPYTWEIDYVRIYEEV